MEPNLTGQFKRNNPSRKTDYFVLTRMSPSSIPLSRRASSTCGVMLTKSMRSGTFIVSVVRKFFIGSSAIEGRIISGGKSRAKGDGALDREPARAMDEDPRRLLRTNIGASR